MDVIQSFLKKNSTPISYIYKSGIETQIKVWQADGEPYKKGFSNGVDYWYNLRVTKKVEITYDISKYVEAIGCSGWNYKEEKSEWVGFDFDSIVGHQKGLTENQINDIIERAKQIDWVTIRRSTSGHGLHLYVFLDVPNKIKSRKEHIAVAKAILSNLSVLLKFDFKAQVDTCGGILWIWHRKAKSFELIKQGTVLTQLPPVEEDKTFKGKVHNLSLNLKHYNLLPNQYQLLNWFSKQKCLWWWDAELNMLVCHTYDLKRAHEELKLRGIFTTISTGAETPNDQNCFAFPLKNGSWIIRRHSPGTKESSNWKIDKSGWTYCYFDKIPTIEDLAELYGGLLNAKSEYIFSSANLVLDILKQIAPNQEISIPEWAIYRQFKLKVLKGSKLSIIFERQENDPLISGWIGNKKTWEKVVNIIEEEAEISLPDNTVRHVISSEENAGWYINIKDTWIFEPKYNIPDALATLGFNKQESLEVIGQCILNPWELINIPFEKEYPGNRQWNKFSPRLVYDPREGKWTLWKKILDHVGKSLTTAVLNNSWCVANNIITGGDYLKYWVASIFQYSLEPLPYLFLYGPQLSGKSSFHEAITLLVTHGVVRADTAITSPSRFNSELAGAILCVIEETNLRKIKFAYDRVKDWTTAKKLTIHAKGKQPIDLDNSTHWIQCANSSSECPISLGDTRIVMIYVEQPEEIMRKQEMLSILKEQAPAFLYEILNLEIPPAQDRFRIPIIETIEKQEEQLASANLVEQFILEECFKRKGHLVLFKEFCMKFVLWLQKNNFSTIDWNPIKIAKSIPLAPQMPVKGRYGGEGYIYLGNISFNEKDENKEFEYIKQGERITIKDKLN